MKKITVYYGCSDTVAACLRSDPDCQTARRLAGLIVRAVQAGRTDAWISEEVKHRSVSAHPFKTHRFNLTARPRSGAPADSAKVTVVEFADFECPFCRVISPKLKETIGSMAGKGVSLVFKHYPVSTHLQSEGAGRAAWAAHQQGKFWPYHDILYKNAPRLSASNLESYARAAGLDMAAFRAARDSQRSSLLLAADKREGLKAGVQGTPTLFINGKMYRGRKDATELRDRLEEELHLVGGGR
jgi:protein-disulfide isomerase